MVECGYRFPFCLKAVQEANDNILRNVGDTELFRLLAASVPAADEELLKCIPARGNRRPRIPSFPRKIYLEGF